MRFDLLHRSGLGRSGLLHTAHGIVETPAFMPVGTQGTVKSMLPGDVAGCGVQMLLGNAYHLYLRPGAEHVASFGGLHEFMGWDGSILTDSGGYQVMSLSGFRSISESGVRFRSHIDGSYHDLTPELVIRIQHLLGSDISMVFDECLALPAAKSEVADSMRRSVRWAERCRGAFEVRDGYGLFGIVQGGLEGDLRLESLASLISIGFDGYAIGGLAVGETQSEMLGVLDIVLPSMPELFPRYLMGVGKPGDIVEAVKRGVDMFDCVIPTRSGRNGQAFTRGGVMNLRNARFAGDVSALDGGCSCVCCRNFSVGYLHHLVRCKEILGSTLLTWHNIQYYQDLMLSLRVAISEDRLSEFVGLI